MIIDSRLEFCDATSLNTGAAGTYLIGSQVDLGAADNVNDIDGLYLVVGVDTTATSGGSATLQITLASDSTAAVATDGSATVHYTSPVIAVASLTAGTYIAKVELPKGTYERYLGILQVTGTAAFTAGKINAFLTNDPYTWKSYADAVA